MKTPEEFAEELNQRVFALIKVAGTDEAYKMAGDNKDSWEHPRYFPAVAWPFEWLVETIKSAQEEHTADGLLEALKELSLDMHMASKRPCATCQKITNLVGWPFGCNARR